MTKKILITGVFTAILVVHLAWRITPWYPADDAYISYRYANNWAAGHGPVFNPDERVEGYSNFLFVAAISLAARAGVTPPLAGRILNLAGGVAILALLLHALPGRLRESKARFPAALFFCVSSHGAANLLSGLETVFFTALVLAGALAFEHRRSFTAALVFLAVSLTRPEGIALAGLICAADLGRCWFEGDRTGRRRILLVWTLTLVVPWTLHLLFRTIYYGHILPNSIQAKMGFTWSQSFQLSSSRYLVPGLTTYWPLLVLTVIGWVALSVRRPAPERRPAECWGVVLLAVSLLGFAARMGSGDPYSVFWRYPFPAVPLFLVLAVLGTERLLAVSSGRFRYVAVPFVAGLLLVQVGLAAKRLPGTYTSPQALTEQLETGIRQFLSQDNRPHEPVDRLSTMLHRASAWLVENSSDDELLVTAEVGIVPYYNPRLRIIDTAGLVTEHIARLPGPPGYKGDPDFVFRSDPDYFVFKKRMDCMCSGIPADVTLFRDSRLRRGYDLAHLIPEGRRGLLIFKKRLEPIPFVENLCERFSPEKVEIRDAEGHLVDHPVRIEGVTGLGSVRLFNEAWRQETLERFQPAIRGEIADFEAADLMREWMGQWRCYTMHLPAASRDEMAIVHRVTVPEGGHLSFAAGLPDDPRNMIPTADVVFEIDLETPDSTVSTIFYQAVTPAPGGAWHVADVDLSAWTGQQVTLSFRIHQESGGSGRTISNSGWAEILLVAGRTDDGQGRIGVGEDG